MLTGLLCSPVALAVAVLAYALGRASRWGPSWLAVPAGSALVWTLEIGAGAAVSGFAALPHAVLGCLARAVARPAALTELPRAAGLGGGWLIGRRLAGQLPLGVVLGAVSAAAASGLDWLRAGRRPLPGARPGPAGWLRRALAATLIRSGSVLSWDGVRLGVDARTGAAVSLSWAQAERAVLITGSDAEAAVSAFQLLQAAIRLRKPVIAVDLGLPGADLAGPMARACAAAGAPLALFGPAEAGRYEPWRERDPALAAALVTGMLDWGEPDGAGRRDCAALLEEAFAAIRLAPADPRTAILDHLIALLRRGPAARAGRAPALRTAGGAPGFAPGGVGTPASAAPAHAGADLHLAAFVAGQLAALRASPVGCCLGPAPVAGEDFPPGPAGGAAGCGGMVIDLPDTLRRRAVACFRLGQIADARIAAMVARLVALDTAAAWSQRPAAGGMSECLAWFAGIGPALSPALAALTGAAAGGGLAIVMAAGGDEAAASLASRAGVLIEHRKAGEFTLAPAGEANGAPRRGLLVAGRIPGPSHGHRR